MLEKFIKNKNSRKAIGFVIRFFLVYVMLNLFYYGYHRLIFPDTVFFTDLAAWQSVQLLSWLGEPVSLFVNQDYPKIHVLRAKAAIVSIYEGCNAASLYIVFLAFIVTFFSFRKELIWFVTGSLIIINVANIVRIVALYYISIYQPDDMYFYHKYVFNVLLFLLVIGLWLLAIKKYHAYKR